MEKLTTLVSGNSEVMRKAVLDALSLPAFILFFTMMGFGSLARGAGFAPEMAALASLLIWGLPGQLAMVELTSTGQGIIDAGGALFQWVTCVSYAMVAGLIFRMIIMPESDLAEVSISIRIAAVVIAFAAYYIFKRRLVAGVVAGGVSLSSLAAWFS